MIGQKKRQDLEKKKVAERAIAYIQPNQIVGVGTGSTARYFIEALAQMNQPIAGAVASSKETEYLLKQHNIEVIELNHITNLSIYVDGADEFNSLRYLIKGGGGALTREKVIAQMAKQFICIVDSSKKTRCLGQFPLPIEVIPMARSFVAREIIKLGAEPIYRENFITDNGNIILDAFHCSISRPIEFEETINHIPGVVGNGLFAKRPADIILIGESDILK